MNTIARFFSWQVRISRSIDRALFGEMAVDGNSAFCDLLRHEDFREVALAEVGGGKSPFFDAAEVAGRGLSVTGIDLDADELGRAPRGAYARTIIGPIERVIGGGDHDVVIAQSVLEHVFDGKLAAKGIGALLKPGGSVYTFCPCKRAMFARLNLLLPEAVKRWLLFFVFPAKREKQGFPAFYDGCSPEEMIRNMTDAGIEPVEVRYFFVSSYFMFAVPVYLVWRLITFPFMKLWPHRYCETFIFIGRKAACG